MPHWCNTSYTVMGDPKELDALYILMKELEERKEPLVKSDFHNTWLGNLVAALGGDYEDIHCRGAWDSAERLEDRVCFNTETAWSEMSDTFDFVRSKFPNLKFYFCAEEDGCQYYVTNDVEGVVYNWRYCFAPHTDDDDDEYYYSENELDCFLSAVSKLVGHQVNTPKEAEEAVYEYNKNQEKGSYAIVRIYDVREDEPLNTQSDE